MNVLVKRTIRNQSGAALLAFLLVFVTAASFALIKGLNEAATQQYRDAQTANALAEAKAALIGYAAAANIVPVSLCGSNCPRPGDLPCPDKNNDGIAEPSCTNSPTCPGLTCRLGRLPWKTLGLSDMRDGAGERLWYAVSNNFKFLNRTSCATSGAAGCLNSDSRGTITIRNPSSTLPHPYDGSNTNPYVKSGAVAAIISPGPVLLRTESGSLYQQVRDCTLGVNCGFDSNGDGDYNDPGDDPEVCTSSPPTNTPKCLPRNYLDRRVASEDNATFVDSSTNGFIQGDIRDAAQNVIVNDKILPISYQDIMPLLERRVVGEILTCLNEYAAPTAPNNGRYPWAAKLGSLGSAPEYSDDSDERFGRLPDGQSTAFPIGVKLTDTQTAIGGSAWDHWPNKDIVPNSNCKLTSNVSPNTWWLNWKELVFYSVAGGFKPTAGPPTCGSAPNNCLTVTPPSLLADKKVVVIAAGKPLQAVPPSGQLRTSADKAEIRNYLESDNATPIPPALPDDTFTVQAPSTTFNDVVCKQGIC